MQYYDNLKITLQKSKNLTSQFQETKQEKTQDSGRQERYKLQILTNLQ